MSIPFDTDKETSHVQHIIKGHFANVLYETKEVSAVIILFTRFVSSLSWSIILMMLLCTLKEEIFLGIYLADDQKCFGNFTGTEFCG